MLGTTYWNSSRSKRGSSPKIQQCLEEEDVIHMSMSGDRGSKQGFLLERRARLVAASEVVHSFTSDQPRLRVAGRLSKTYLKAGENVDGLALSNL